MGAVRAFLLKKRTVFSPSECALAPKQGESTGLWGRLEASPGIEPGYKDLQSSASPLRHEASQACMIKLEAHLE